MYTTCWETLTVLISLLSHHRHSQSLAFKYVQARQSTITFGAAISQTLIFYHPLPQWQHGMARG